MITLNLKRDPYWINLQEEVRLFVRPQSTAIMSAAQSIIASEIAALKAVGDEKMNYAGLSVSLLIKALARLAIIKWEGVLLDANSEAVAPVTDENINKLMDYWFIAQDFWAQYASSFSTLEQEGKPSEPAPSGTTVAAPDIATDAKRKVSRAAKGKKTR